MKNVTKLLTLGSLLISTACVGPEDISVTTTESNTDSSAVMASGSDENIPVTCDHPLEGKWYTGQYKTSFEAASWKGEFSQCAIEVAGCNIRLIPSQPEHPDMDQWGSLEMVVEATGGLIPSGCIQPGSYTCQSIIGEDTTYFRFMWMFNCDGTYRTYYQDQN